jgi:hypothetical protein
MIDRLKADLRDAMRSGDRIRIDTIRMLVSQIQYARIELKHEPGEEDLLVILRRGVKTRREAVEQYEKGGRTDLADKERSEIGIIEAYLPASMSAEETSAAIDALLTELDITEKKDMGRAMKEFMARYRGRVDGKSVNALIAARLK